MAPSTTLRAGVLSLFAVASLALAACAPAAPPAPTSAPPQPAKAAPTVAPTAAPQPTAAPKPAPPTAAPAAKPTAKPAAFDERAVADFYGGKTVRIMVGFGPGAAFDYYARQLARYMPPLLPGKPNMIVENKPGAASMLAANLVYNTEPKDGTVIAMFNQNLVLQQALGAEGIQYDARKFQWLGSVDKPGVVCMARNDSGVKSIRDTIGGKELVVGTSGPGSSGHDAARLMAHTLGANFKLVAGYADVAKQRLAFEGGEVAGFCTSADYVRETGRSLVEGDAAIGRAIVILGAPMPDLPFMRDVPVADSLAKDQEARQLLRVLDIPSRMSRPFAVAPEVPADRVAALRKAMAAALADPQFLAEAQKAGRVIEPSTGEEIGKLVQELFSTPPATTAKLKELLK